VAFYGSCQYVEDIEGEVIWLNINKEQTVDCVYWRVTPRRATHRLVAPEREPAATAPAYPLRWRW
jgi:hypothetical protein